MLNERKHKRICVLLALMLCFGGIVSSLDNIFNNFLPGVPLNSGIIYIAYFVLILWVIVDNGAKMSIDMILVLMGSCLMFLCVLIFHPQNIEYMWTDMNDVLANPLFMLLCFAFVGYFVSRKLEDSTTFIVLFERFSICTIVLSLIRYFSDLKLLLKGPEYMSFSYNLLLPTVFVLLLCIQNFKWYRMIAALVGVILIFVAGCRGALVGALVSILIYIFFYGKLTAKKKYSISAILLILTSAVAFFYKQIFDFLNAILSAVGISSRTVELLLSFSFFDDSGRSDIIQNIIGKIDLLGHGLWGDRVALDGSYAHNLVIEILYDFGLIFGILILVVLAIVILKGIKCADEKMAIILCALISAGLIKLFVSSSFLNQEPAFYVLIGMCVNSIKQHRNSVFVNNGK